MSIPPVSATATTNARCPSACVCHSSCCSTVANEDFSVDIDQSADEYSGQEESDQGYKPGGCCDPTCNIL